MASIHMTVTLVRDRKRFWINTPNGRVTLKDWCDRHAPGAYNSIHARVKHLAAGENYSALPDAIQAITATRKRRAVQAAARAARGMVELTALQRRLAESAVNSLRGLCDLLGFDVVITKRADPYLDSLKPNTPEYRAAFGCDDMEVEIKNLVGEIRQADFINACRAGFTGKLARWIDTKRD